MYVVGAHYKCLNECLHHMFCGEYMYSFVRYSFPLTNKKNITFWFVCVEVLQPSQLNGVMLSVVSLPDHKKLSPLSG